MIELEGIEKTVGRSRVITIYSKWNDWETTRIVIDEEGNPIEPVRTEVMSLKKKVKCWFCEGKKLLDPFVESGRIEPKPCHRCGGKGYVILNEGSYKIDGIFEINGNYTIKRYERRGDWFDETEINISH